MLSDIQRLIDEIEIRRKELEESGQDFSDPDTIKKSQHLDELINKYYKLMYGNSSEKNVVSF